MWKERLSVKERMAGTRPGPDNYSRWTVCKLYWASQVTLLWLYCTAIMALTEKQPLNIYEKALACTLCGPTRILLPLSVSQWNITVLTIKAKKITAVTRLQAKVEEVYTEQTTWDTSSRRLDARWKTESMSMHIMLIKVMTARWFQGIAEYSNFCLKCERRRAVELRAGSCFIVDGASRIAEEERMRSWTEIHGDK